MNNMLHDRANPQRWSITQALRKIHLDAILLLGLLTLLGVGLMILYSAGDQSSALMIRQFTRMGAALLIMLAISNIHLINMLAMIFIKMFCLN